MSEYDVITYSGSPATEEGGTKGQVQEDMGKYFIIVEEDLDNCYACVTLDLVRAAKSAKRVM